MRRVRSSVERAVERRLRFGAYDLATRDKIPRIRELIRADGEGLALDVGSGIGYTTYTVFGERSTVCVDVHLPNLRYYAERVMSVDGSRRPLCVVALATALPFKAGMFRFVLSSEVLEHVEDDDGTVRELARVLAPDGRVVITVPYTGLGFTSFLELVGVKTVHDFPGPEYHVRPGYDERVLGRILARHGLELERHTYYFRFFTRALADCVSIAHLLYQRVVYRRRAWNWAEAAGVEGSWAFRLYAGVFPVLWMVSRIDGLLRGLRGFGLVAAATKRATVR